MGGNDGFIIANLVLIHNVVPFTNGADNSPSSP